ncbi:tRNA (adenosine(37)-N6)-threonylcarbamoyltransferase complex dimerization subunit type 1 TsaB [Candidatus Thioglobus sp.]|uniref:tRNA (adenosine(37)-N6)-threonylcarbamoyltransferase complex dimerization subunit type 1 TsaB n=1 Tax=Candidatus Thioglobus sp. TaxID=2026721 RepID=UPI003D141230
MKNILAIDTCTEVCSVSLYTQSKKTSRFLKDVAKSSALILPLCHEVLEQAKLTIQDLDLIVYTKGPGAFTGVRMCVSVVQGLSLAFNTPTLGFSTLELVGYGAGKKYQTDKIAVALDARMNEVYWGVYQAGQLLGESLKNPSEVERLNADYMGVGSGWGAYKQQLVDRSGVVEHNAHFYPMAENLIDLSLTYVNKYGFLDDNLPLPTYLRNNVAKKSLK